jgi:hypothetical protein
MSKKTRFSDHFGLGKAQSQLDFVDIPVETDIPLFVDPYALHISSQDWLRECGNSVVEYFQTLIDQIRKGNKKSALELLDNFHEPNETHLGFSSSRPSGRGWGPWDRLHRMPPHKTRFHVVRWRITDAH